MLGIIFFSPLFRISAPCALFVSVFLFSPASMQAIHIPYSSRPLLPLARAKKKGSRLELLIFPPLFEFRKQDGGGGKSLRTRGKYYKKEPFHSSLYRCPCEIFFQLNRHPGVPRRRRRRRRRAIRGQSANISTIIMLQLYGMVGNMKCIGDAGSNERIFVLNVLVSMLSWCLGGEGKVKCFVKRVTQIESST